MRHALTLLLLAGVAGCPEQPPASSSDAGFVHWIGLDSRPLAVGSQLIVTLDIATDAGATPSYQVISTEPDIVDVEQIDGGRLLLSVRSEGQATLELRTSEATANLVVRASLPDGVQFYDAEEYAAGVGAALKPGKSFDLLSSSQERLQGVVVNSDCEPLNSWGLIDGRNPTNTPLTVSSQPPEQFILASGASGQFVGGISGAADGGNHCDAGSISASYAIDVVSSAPTMQLVEGAPDGLVVIAQATNGKVGSDTRVVFGVDDWEFSCTPPATCTIVPLSPSVVAVKIPAHSGQHTVFAASSSQGSAASLLIP